MKPQRAQRAQRSKKNATCIGGRVIMDLLSARIRQDRECGGPKHDDQHTPLDWMQFVTKQVNKLTANIIENDAEADYDGTNPYFSTADCRQRFVEIGAIAIAAIESMDRIAKAKEAAHA